MNYKAKDANGLSIKHFYTGALVATSVLATVSLSQMVNVHADAVDDVMQTAVVASRGQLKSQAQNKAKFTSSESTQTVANDDADISETSDDDEDVNKSIKDLKETIAFAKYVLKWEQNADKSDRDKYENLVNSIKEEIYEGEYDIENLGKHGIGANAIDAIEISLHSDAFSLSQGLVEDGVPKPDENKVDKSNLQKAIDKANSLLKKSDKYTIASVAKLKEVLSDAKGVNTNDDATQVQVDNATDALNKAIKGLELTGNSDNNDSKDSNENNDTSSNDDTKDANENNTHNQDADENNSKHDNGSQSRNDETNTGKANSNTGSDVKNDSSSKDKAVVSAGSGSSNNNQIGNKGKATTAKNSIAAALLPQTGEKKQQMGMIAGLVGIAIAAFGAVGFLKRRN